MKITKQLLKKMIQEEVKNINEGLGMAFSIKGVDLYPALQGLSNAIHTAKAALDPKVDPPLDERTRNSFQDILEAAEKGRQNLMAAQSRLDK